MKKLLSENSYNSCKESFEKTFNNVEICGKCGTLKVAWSNYFKCYTPRCCRCVKLAILDEKYIKLVTPINNAIIFRNEDGIDIDDLLRKKELLLKIYEDEVNKWIRFFKKDDAILKKMMEEAENGNKI